MALVQEACTKSSHMKSRSKTRREKRERSGVYNEQYIGYDWKLTTPHISFTLQTGKPRLRGPRHRPCTGQGQDWSQSQNASFVNISAHKAVG